MDHLEFSDSDDEFFEYTEAHRRQPQNRHFNEKVFEDDLPEILRQQQVRVPEEVVNLLEVRLTNQLQYNQPRKGMLTVREQLLLFLHFVGTNSFFHVMRDVHGPSVSTVCRTVHRVASAISSLQQEVISWPSDQSSVATKFYQIAKFPRVAGAADGTHITVFPPNYQEDDFVNRHHQHSINVLAVAGPNHEFFYVNANYPGKCHDSHVMQESSLWREFERGWRPFDEAIILADSAYPLKEWLITPFRGVPQGPQTTFNSSHIKTRMVVEQAFGIIKKRFYILSTGIRFRKMQDASKIILACFVLHNLCIQHGDHGEEGSEDEGDDSFDELLMPAEDQNNLRNPRNKFVAFFQRN